jgi:hypothetical protein
MPKKTKTEPDYESKTTLHRAEELIYYLLQDFSSNGVRALMIVNKDGKVFVRSNGISGAALLPFLVDLFFKEPHLYMACAEIIRDRLKEARAELAASATVH